MKALEKAAKAIAEIDGEMWNEGRWDYLNNAWREQARVRALGNIAVRRDATGCEDCGSATTIRNS